MVFLPVATKWLGATAIHSQSKDTANLVGSLTALCDNYPQLSILVNFFDAKEVPAQAIMRQLTGNHSRLGATWVPGMKTLFWKLHLTPEITKDLELVWVFDCDIAIHPSVFPLGQLAGALKATRATMLQPAIQAWIHGTYHTFLRVKRTHMSCFATTAQWNEMQTPLFSGDAWARFHTKMLSTIPEAGLVTSDFGLDIVWCAFMKDEFPNRPACLVTPGIAATHLNSHAIEAYMSPDVKRQERSCTTTCKSLFDNFKHYWKNFSHHTGQCYGEKENVGLHYQGGRFTQDGDGTVRARFSSRGETTVGASIELSEDSSESTLAHLVDAMPKGVGATSIDSSDKRLTPLVQSLSRLCSHMPGLKQVVINMNDPGGPGSRAGGRLVDASTDSRITTTWVRGSRVLFWKEVLSPQKLGDRFDYIWLFDASLTVHPAVNALNQLVYALKSTDASLAFVRPETHADVGASHIERDCIASTTTNPLLSTASTVIKAGAWKTLYNGVFRRFETSQLEKIDAGMELVACGAFAGVKPPPPRSGQIGSSVKSPACVEVHRWRPYSQDNGRTAGTRRECDPKTCLMPLERTFPKIFNTTWHDDGRCWVAGPKGLTQTRRRLPRAWHNNHKDYKGVKNHAGNSRQVSVASGR